VIRVAGDARPQTPGTGRQLNSSSPAWLTPMWPGGLRPPAGAADVLEDASYPRTPGRPVHDLNALTPTTIERASAVEAR